MFIPLAETLALTGKTITVDALLTQRSIARYLVEERSAHYLFTVKGNQANLLADLTLLFEKRDAPDFSEIPTLAHGRIEQRMIWCSSQLNDYVNFPHVGQAVYIERHSTDKKTGKTTIDSVYGITSHIPQTADAQRLLAFNRDHWGVESHHYILDWNWDEDRCTIRTRNGPANITSLRRFATGLIKNKSSDSVTHTIQKLARSVRRVFDYLRMTKNSIPRK